MREIPLTRRDGTPCGTAIIDDEDEDLAQYRWRRHTHGYAWRSTTVDGRPRDIYLHREIARRMGLLLDGDGEPDHADGDTLNNRRSNIRHATHQQNSVNRRGWRWSARGSAFKGVRRDRAVPSKPWRAEISIDGRTMFLGRFATEEAAARAYDDAAARHFGEFARLNF